MNKSRTDDQEYAFQQSEPTKERDQNSPAFRPNIVVIHDKESNDNCHETGQVGQSCVIEQVL